jgi:hypothetical protein
LDYKNLNHLALITYRFRHDIAGRAVELAALRQQQRAADCAGAGAPGQHVPLEHELASGGLT